MPSLALSKMLRESRWTGVLCVLAAALALGLYFRTGLFDFCSFDDPSYITMNGLVQSKLTWANVASTFSFAQPMYWHPATTLSFMVDGQFFRLWAGGYHVVNALWHCGNVALFFVLALLLTRSRFAAFFCALIFAVHPAHVESVAWISERKDVLSTFFGLAAVILYIRWARRPGALLAVCMYAAYLLSLMAKPMFVTLPGLLLLLDYWPLRRFSAPEPPDLPDTAATFAAPGAQARPWPWPDWRQLVPRLREKVLFLALGLFVTFMTLSTHRVTQDKLDPDLWLKLANAFASITKYLVLLFWPSHQAVIYPYPASVPLAQSLGGAALVLALTGLCLWQARRRPYFLVGWLWFLCALAPVIMPPKVGLHVAMADRWTYVPFLGLYLALGAWGAELLAGSARHLSRAALAAVFLLPAVPLMLVQQRQLTTWESSEALYEQAMRVTTGNYLVLGNYGALKVMAGDNATGERYLLEALRYHPDFAICKLNLGLLRTEQQRYDEALAYLLSAVPRLAKEGQGYDAYRGMARCLTLIGKGEVAQHFLAAAIREQPKRAEAFTEWGHLARVLGNQELAQEFFRQMQADGTDGIGSPADLERLMAGLRKP